MPKKNPIVKQEKIPSNCPDCNGKLDLKKTLGKMRFGTCEKCRRTYALL